MALSKRRQIQEAIINQLKTIGTAGGYLTELGAYVYEEVEQHLIEDDAEMVLVVHPEFPEPQPIAGGLWSWSMRVNLQLGVNAAGQPTTPMDTYDAMAQDVLAALAVDRTLGGLVESMTLASPDQNLRQNELFHAAAWLPIEITYETGLWSL